MTIAITTWERERRAPGPKQNIARSDIAEVRPCDWKIGEGRFQPGCVILLKERHENGRPKEVHVTETKKQVDKMIEKFDQEYLASSRTPLNPPKQPT